MIGKNCGCDKNSFGQPKNSLYSLNGYDTEFYIVAYIKRFSTHIINHCNPSMISDGAAVLAWDCAGAAAVVDAAVELIFVLPPPPSKNKYSISSRILYDIFLIPA